MHYWNNMIKGNNMIGAGMLGELLSVLRSGYIARSGLRETVIIRLTASELKLNIWWSWAAH